MLSQQEDGIIDLLALYSISGIGSMNARKLIAYAGSAKKVLQLNKKELLNISGVGMQLAERILEKNHYKKAEEEIQFAEKYHINIISYFSDKFPYRLKQCEDSPLVIFTKGKHFDADQKYISIVGTRKATKRGENFCNKLIEDLKLRGHNVVIVSGLAYGIDIAAHKAALKHNVPTIGVLAHGLDTIYPTAHRNAASEIVEQGTLVTEFFHGGYPHKINFVRRNRIIAGLCDCTIVVESDIKGGSLLTADMANSYSRDVFAVPGRLDDKYATGCNKLIKSNKAALIESVDDLEYVMGWEQNKKPKQMDLFSNLSADEQKIMNLFKENNELTIDVICRMSGITMSRVSANLLTLEFSGLLRCLPGKVFTKN